VKIGAGEYKMNFRQERVLSGQGTASHQFQHRLSGIDIDHQDCIYAVGDLAVKVFDSEGSLLRTWTTSHPGLSLGLDDHAVYVGGEGLIEIFEPSGRLLRTWSDPERLGRVTAIALLDEEIFVADSLARCIRRFNRKGSFLNNIGDTNRMKGFNIPNGLLDFAIDSDGVIHACNPGKHRVERYHPDGKLLGHIGRFDGRDPEGFPGCCNPTNVAVTDLGYLYVTEKAGPRVKVLDLAGHLISVVASEIFDPNCKNMDVAVDSRGWVYVIDTVRLRINVFVPEGEERVGLPPVQENFQR